jgi:hypothetical protein
MVTAISKSDTIDKQRLAYSRLRERTERQQRRRQQLIERLVAQQRERALRRFRRPLR